MLRRTNPELAFGAFFQLTNGNAGHAINDIIAIIDCIILRLGSLAIREHSLLTSFLESRNTVCGLGVTRRRQFSILNVFYILPVNSLK